MPVLVASAGERAGLRFLEFFAAAIRNQHTRRAYARAASDFLAWCAGAGVSSIAAVQPLHVASWVELQTRTHAAPTVKQRLAAIRHLFDWLVTGQVVPHNPAASVRGPSHVTKTGKTPVLEAAEARQLLDSIDVTTPAGLRDRALIALMVFSFARIGAALAMRVDDVYVQQRRLWVRLREKGGKAHADAMPPYARGGPACVSRWHRNWRRPERAAVPHDRARYPGSSAARRCRRRTRMRWCAGARRRPASRPRLATIPSARPASLRTCRTAARSRTPRRWPTTHRRVPRSCTTDAATPSASTRSSGFNL
ncbi:integrase/recombinase [Burkholderia multivorans]|nr:integrase/recombinase [Burkholderia multivorans]